MYPYGTFDIFNKLNALMQIDDIHRVKLLGISWLVYAANELTALHLNGWLAFTRAVHSRTF